MHPYLNIAVNAARSAGRIISQAADRIDRVEVAHKTSASDLVTSIDRAAEAEIIAHIHKAYPDHGILAEESGAIAGTNINNVIWIIDPLDGTLNFVHGLPYYCVSIGIQIKGVMQHAVVYNPINGELFTASKGYGAQLNDRKIRVSNCQTLENALVSPAFAYRRAKEELSVAIARLELVFDKAAGMRRGGAVALELANIAAGRLDALWEVGLGAWDAAAGALIVREAGGFVGELDTGEDNFMDTGKILAGTPRVYLELVKLLQNS